MTDSHHDTPPPPSPPEHLGWCLIPPTVLARVDLSLRQKVLIGRILGLLTPDGYCYASNAWLATQLGVAKHTIANLLSNMTKKGILTIQLITNDTGQVTQRRIYPALSILENLTSASAGRVFPKSGRVFLKSGMGIPENRNRCSRTREGGPSRNQEGEGRDKREEKRGAARRPAHTLPLGPLFDHPDTPRPDRPQTTPAESAPAAPPTPRPPYLPAHFPLDHPVCQVLTRFATRWRAISGHTLDLAVPRAIKEIHARLSTTPLADLLDLVALWFDPGLSWVTESERGSFHTFIQPRPISELKGLKAGLSTRRAPRAPAAARGYTPPTPHAGWRDLPPGKTSLP